MNPETKELLNAAESALGFVWGEQYEESRERRDLPPLVPQRVRGLAAEQVFMGLAKAVDAFKAARNGQPKLEPMTE